MNNPTPDTKRTYTCALCPDEITVADNANGGLITVNVDGHAKAAHRHCAPRCGALHPDAAEDPKNYGTPCDYPAGHDRIEDDGEVWDHGYRFGGGIASLWNEYTPTPQWEVVEARNPGKGVAPINLEPGDRIRVVFEGTIEELEQGFVGPAPAVSNPHWGRVTLPHWLLASSRIERLAQTNQTNQTNQEPKQ